jgi:hypothetical protein
MEDTEQFSNNLEDTEVIPTKAKRVMSEKQKEVLARARVKAWQKRRELGDISRQEKELKKQEIEVKKQERATEMNIRKKAVNKKLKKTIFVSDDDSDEDEQVITDHSESEEEVEVKQMSKRIEKRLKVTKAPTISQEETVELFRQKIINDGKRIAYQSLFPGSQCPF